MLSIINFVPKVQALDKSAATLAEIRRQLGQVQVLSLIALTEKNRIDRIDSLIELVSRVSDETLFVGDAKLHKSATTYLRENGQLGTAAKDNEDCIQHLNKWLSGRGQTIFMAPVGGGNGELNKPLLHWAKSAGVPILGYFKSLHDQGMGLSTMAGNNDGARKLTDRLWELVRRSRLIGLTENAGELSPTTTNWLMVFNQRHAQTVAAKAGRSQLIETGYQLLFPAWRELVLQSPYCQSYPRGQRLEVVLFTRGETPGRPSEENVVSHDALAQLVADILAELDATGRDWHLRIKPHPIQDVSFLSRLIAGRPNAEIVYEAPALLAATADIAIATYSSTVVDTLANGVPTIEYFFETDFFKKKHPAGSPFPKLGALKARNAGEFSQSLLQVLNDSPRVTPATGITELSRPVDFSFIVTNPK